jgi:calcineurin-like phosphoesterase family protein
MDWFTADWHFLHDKIIEYCDRPFKNINKMQRYIIKRVNEHVDAENDTLYVIGDITLKNSMYKYNIENLVSQMKCEKIFILGNHDKMNAFHYVDMGFKSVHTYLYLPEREYHLVHDPSACQDIENKKWVCGHVHNLFTQLHGRVINVGVDVWGFRPVSADELELLWGKKDV